MQLLLLTTGCGKCDNMKLKSGFVLHKAGNEYVVVAIEERTKEFSGIINLNKSGAFLWEQMTGEFTREDLAAALLCKYDITEEKAKASAAEFLNKLLSLNVIED